MVPYAQPEVEGLNLYEYFTKYKSQFMLVENKNGLDLYSVKYLHMGVDWTMPYMMDARGIIIDSQGRIIGRPYKKFFNFGQLQPIPFIDESIKHLSLFDDNVPFWCLDKLDGSLVIVSYYDVIDDVLTASSGSTSGEYADLFKEWFKTNLTPDKYEVMKEISKKYTLAMEYLSPEKRIVIGYPETDIKLHGVIETLTGKVLSYPEMVATADKIGLNYVENIKGLDTLEDIQNYIAVTKGIEGLVVCFENGKMLKFKTEEYRELHDSTSDINTSRPYSKGTIVKVLDMFLEGTLDDFVASIFDSPYHKKLLEAINDVEGQYKEAIAKFYTTKQLATDNLLGNMEDGLYTLDRKLIFTSKDEDMKWAACLVTDYNNYVTNIRAFLADEVDIMETTAKYINIEEMIAVLRRDLGKKLHKLYVINTEKIVPYPLMQDIDKLQTQIKKGTKEIAILASNNVKQALSLRAVYEREDYKQYGVKTFEEYMQADIYHTNMVDNIVKTVKKMKH